MSRSGSILGMIALGNAADEIARRRAGCAVVAATGRRPVTTGLGLENAAMGVDEGGFIVGQ